MSLEIPPEAAVEKRSKVVAIRADLHAALKGKAKREGRVLQAMVEEKLEELVAPEQLTLEVVK